MASPSPSSKDSGPGPGSLRSAKTFSHQDEAENVKPINPSKRAQTFQSGAVPEVTINNAEQQSAAEPDTFENESDEETIEPPRASVDIEDIPIELVSMTDNFIDSLSAKVNPSPPNIDNLSRRFQDFYESTSAHIQTHISSLATRHIRDGSRRPSPLPKAASAASLLRAKAASLGNRDKTKQAPIDDPDQQMITAEEFADRKKARKELEQKKFLLEEGVERRLCEGIYHRIYRHHTTQDEAQDDKLRSKTAALSMVGIGPGDLGVNLGELPPDDPEAAQKRQKELREYLDQARNDLIRMSEKRYPLGKLNSLKAAHKSIVDALSHFHPSSSADEIMPMLIYTLITMPPERLHVISDSRFIQRFRWEEKMEGEAAYCLTNLDAAITFLETVDLASLRSDETPSGPGKSENQVETFPPAYTAGLSSSPDGEAVVDGDGTRPSASSAAKKDGGQRRRLSDLIHTPAQAMSTASDSIFTTADQSFKTVGTSLGDSYNFLLGKFRDVSASGRELHVPRTLDDARKLIGTPPPDDDVSLVGGEDGERGLLRRDERILSLVGGKKPATRDHSTDSARSGRSANSSKKVAFAADDKGKSSLAASSTSSSSANNPSLVESARNFSSSFNPMNRLAGMSVMRGFGRAPATGGNAAVATKDGSAKNVEGGDLGTAFPDIAAALPPKNMPKVDPPIKRFMELESPGDLRLGEVLELLRDYRRLAGTLKDMGMVKE